MAQDVYTYLKADNGNLTYSNTLDGNYEPVDENTITAKAKSGDQVIWQCEGGIASISAISRSTDPDNPNIFDARGILPSPTDPKCWSGKIKTGFSGRKIEKYNITWVDVNGRTFTLDPGVQGDGDDV